MSPPARRVEPHDPHGITAERLRSHGGPAWSAAMRLLRCRDAAAAALADACRALADVADGADLAAALHQRTLIAAMRYLPERCADPKVPIEPLLPTFAADGHRRDVRPAWTTHGAAAFGTRTGALQLQQQIDRLPDGHRTLLILVDVEGLPIHTAASMLGLFPALARDRLRAARQALRELIDRSFADAASDARGVDRD